MIGDNVVGQIIKTWVDVLCSECYRCIKTNVSDDEYYKNRKDDTEWCDDCKDWIFPIVVLKREYDTRKVVSKGHQKIEREIVHGVEIIHIDGEGITMNAEKIGWYDES
jgi:hypothetical protein